MVEITEEISQGMKDIQLEIAQEINRICEKHNLRYYLAYGTLIGAIRHQGFIPWDDDLDIMMPYEDMKKFEEIASEELDSKYFFQSPNTDKEYRLTINRVRKNYTLLAEESTASKNIHKGLFVDIYPLFGVPEGKLASKKLVGQAMLRALYLLGEPVKNHGTLMRIGSLSLLKLKSRKSADKVQNKLLKKMLRYNNSDAKYLSALDSEVKSMRTRYNVEWFGEGVLHKFEDTNLRVPDNADAVLKKYYGEYMELPPEESRLFHHNYERVALYSDIERGE